MGLSRMMDRSIWLFLITVSSAWSADDFCAVTVNVVDPMGEPISVPVELAAVGGRVIDKQLAHDGVARFCDFGFGDHTIRVGEDCGFVTLNRIRLVYQHPQWFRVVLNYCTIGGDGGVFPPSCLVYIRVSSQAGAKLSGAEASLEGGQHIVPADRYGRLYFAIRQGASYAYKVSAAGYADHVVRLSCENPTRIERAVELQRAR
jgi:hypothetical protein